MAKANLNVPGNFQRAAFGQNGFEYLTGNAANLEGDFVAIQALSQAVVSVTVSEGDALASVTVPTGVTIYGPFKSVDLTSGTVLAYRA
jgi:hypothetical protein